VGLGCVSLVLASRERLQAHLMELVEQLLLVTISQLLKQLLRIVRLGNFTRSKLDSSTRAGKTLSVHFINTFVIKHIFKWTLIPTARVDRDRPSPAIKKTTIPLAGGLLGMRAEFLEHGTTPVR